MLSARKVAFHFGFLCLLFCSLALPGRSQENVIHLLTGSDLSPFYTCTKEHGTNQDPDNVFMMTNGVLHVSGQNFGYLATRREYSNYKLVAEFKWGEETWGERLTNARDSGILVHLGGKDQVWPKCIECQMIEGGTGDMLVVSGAYITVDGVRKGPRIERFDRPGRNPWQDIKGFRGPHEIENPHGEWNTLEVVCDGGKVGITVNGHKTIEGTNAIPAGGKIGIQTEGAEVFFRRLDVYPLHAAPKD
jgi:hypothetical protein